MGAKHDVHVAELRTCTHGDDEAVHREVLAWADAWARKIHAETPPGVDHDAHEIERIWGDEVFREMPQHFRQCGWRLKNFIKDALVDLHAELHRDGQHGAPTGQ